MQGDKSESICTTSMEITSLVVGMSSLVSLMLSCVRYLVIQIFIGDGVALLCTIFYLYQTRQNDKSRKCDWKFVQWNSSDGNPLKVWKRERYQGVQRFLGY